MRPSDDPSDDPSDCPRLWLLFGVTALSGWDSPEDESMEAEETDAKEVVEAEEGRRALVVGALSTLRGRGGRTFPGISFRNY